MVAWIKNNFFVLPALVLALLFYGSFVPLRTEEPPSIPFAAEDLAAVECVLLSGPAKFGASGKKSLCRARLVRALSKDGLSASASGIADIFLPSALSEIYQPGKLYSAWRGKKIDFLLDAGAAVVFSARASPFFGKNDGQKKLAFEADGVLSCAFRPGLFGRLQRARAASRLHFSRLMFAWGSAGGFLLALLSGSRAYLEDGLSSAFRKAGLSHILALSGMHLSLVGGLAFAAGKKSFGKRIAPLVQLLSILAFVWFAGKSPSLFRALLCALLSLCAPLFKARPKSALNSLALVFIVHACIFPADVQELSFALSYGALAGILALGEFFSRRLVRAFPACMGRALGESAGAQALTMPICARAFGVLSPCGIISSAALSPLVSVFVQLGLFCILLSLAFPVLAPACGGLVRLLYALIRGLALFFSRVPCLKIPGAL